ncbi:MAG: cobalt ECF transporter T component CbiQ [Cyanobacteria bacterium RI_101]|nr:cobalt ECF transporter T component CbiQ [Cyanobacteria bacterium RI_101]
MGHSLDALAQTNGLRALPPEQKLGFAAALFFLAYGAPIPVQGLIALWLFVWVVKYAQIPASIYLRLLSLPLTFLLLGLPAWIIGAGRADQLATFRSDVLWGAPIGSFYLYLSQQGLEQSRGIFFRSLALTSCLYFLLLTVPLGEIILVLGRWGCPALLTELMTLMYRFIGVLGDTASQLLAAQQSRLGYGTWRRSLGSFSLLAGRLLQRTLINYREISLGLASRGYTGELKFWSRRRHQASWRYGAEAVGGYLFLLALTGWHYWAGSC